MKYDFLRDAQADAWAARIKGETYRRPSVCPFWAATGMGALLGALAICVYLAVNGA